MPELDAFDRAAAEAAMLHQLVPSGGTEVDRLRAVGPDLADRLEELCDKFEALAREERLAELRRDRGELRMVPSVSNRRIADRLFVEDDRQRLRNLFGDVS